MNALAVEMIYFLVEWSGTIFKELFDFLDVNIILDSHAVILF